MNKLNDSEYLVIVKLLLPPRTISLFLHLFGSGVHAQLLPAKLASAFTIVTSK
jgi:hypothetical protein